MGNQRGAHARLAQDGTGRTCSINVHPHWEVRCQHQGSKEDLVTSTDNVVVIFVSVMHISIVLKINVFENMILLYF